MESDLGGRGSDVLAAPETIAPISDEDLIKGIQAGDEASFGIFYDRYFVRIYHFVNLRLRNHADSEEVVQESIHQCGFFP